MTQASADEDGVSWIEEAGGPTCTETVTSMDSAANLTPAEVSNFRRRPKWLHKNQPQCTGKQILTTPNGHSSVFNNRTG